MPTLLYPEVVPVWEFGAHAGTNDLDLALDLVILELERYENVARCLKRGGFAPDRNEKGKPTRQRWTARNGAQVDFVMPPVPPDKNGGRQQSLTSEFAAVTMRGLDLALITRQHVILAGEDLDGLKALAIAGRDKPKDAYDIQFVLLHDRRGPRGLGQALRAYRPHEAIDAAVNSLRRDYKEVDSRGPRDVCSFLGRPADDDIAGAALAYMLEFLDAFT